MKPLSPARLATLRHLATFTDPAPMRVLARGLQIPPQRMASRVWHLRRFGLADKPGDEAYTITQAGRDLLAAGNTA